MSSGQRLTEHFERRKELKQKVRIAQKHQLNQEKFTELSCVIPSTKHTSRLTTDVESHLKHMEILCLICSKLLVGMKLVHAVYQIGVVLTTTLLIV